MAPGCTDRCRVKVSVILEQQVFRGVEGVLVLRPRFEAICQQAASQYSVVLPLPALALAVEFPLSRSSQVPSAMEAGLHDILTLSCSWQKPEYW
jgi:hypothetical protein